MADAMDERDEVTLRTLAYMERTTLAEQRRRALHDYATRARRRKNVADLVALILASRQAQRERPKAPSNVIPLRKGSHG